MPTAPELAKRLQEQFPGLVSDAVEFRGEWTVRLGDAARIAEVCDFAKKVLGFNFLVDVSSLDNLGEDPRFTLVYHLYGHGHHCQLRLKADLSEEKGEAPTVTGVWQGADWHEREVFDMMGIRFAGHPDLRRILMWEGYPYFPLRKDFPLAGRESDMPELAFSRPAPQSGGPFVTVAGGKDTMAREPRSHVPETTPAPEKLPPDLRTVVEDRHTAGGGGKGADRG